MLPVGKQAISPEDDFYAWLLDQAAAMRSQQYDRIAWELLAEELEGMARKEKREVISSLRILLAHLLKWRYSSTSRSERSWKGSMLRSRLKLFDVLEGSGRLRNEFPECLAKAYGQACLLAGAEMGLDKSERQRLFPTECPWDYEQLLDQDFLPDTFSVSNGQNQ